MLSIYATFLCVLNVNKKKHFKNIMNKTDKAFFKKKKIFIFIVPRYSKGLVSISSGHKSIALNVIKEFM